MWEGVGRNGKEDEDGGCGVFISANHKGDGID